MEHLKAIREDFSFNEIFGKHFSQVGVRFILYSINLSRLNSLPGYRTDRRDCKSNKFRLPMTIHSDLILGAEFDEVCDITAVRHFST